LTFGLRVFLFWKIIVALNYDSTGNIPRTIFNDRPTLLLSFYHVIWFYIFSCGLIITIVLFSAVVHFIEVGLLA